MAFNPFNLFKGNPRVLELMNNNENLQQILLEESFISEFKKTDNEAIQTYMNYERYQQLINYITKIQCDQSNKNRAFKYLLVLFMFPYMAAEILSVNNQNTLKYLLEEVVFTESEIQEQIEVERQIDSQSSDRSYSSIKSNNSNTAKKQHIDNKEYAESDKQNFVLRTEKDKTLSQYQFMDEIEISQEDFPDVKRKKIILVREMVKRTVKKPYQPLVFKLLRHFQSKEIIHILDGYVCKVLENVINNKFEKLLNLLINYHKTSLIKVLFTHAASNSVQELLVNFINKLMENPTYLALSQEETLLQFIQEICEAPYDSWSENQSILEEKISIIGLYSLIIEKSTTKLTTKIKQRQRPQIKQQLNLQMQLLLLSKILQKAHLQKSIQVMTQIVKYSQSNEIMPKIIYQYAKIIMFLIICHCNIKDLLKNEFVRQPDLKFAKQIVQSTEDCFDKIIQTIFTYVFQKVLHLDNEELKVYKGKHSLISKIELLDIVGLLAKENIYFSRKSIIDNSSFEHLLKLLDIYPKSSIFHNSVLKIILPFLSDTNEVALINKFFQKSLFFSCLYDIVQKDSEARFENKGIGRKCYISHIASICLAIQNLENSQSSSLLEYKQSYQWQYINQYLIQDEKEMKKASLGNHQKLTAKKPIIFFSKESCLQHFKHFLSGMAFNRFDDFQNYDPGNSDSEQEKQHESSHVFQSQKMQIDETISTEAPIQGDDSKYFTEDYVL